MTELEKVNNNVEKKTKEEPEKPTFIENDNIKYADEEDIDIFEADYEHNFLIEVETWLKKVKFSTFSKTIKKSVIGQENVDIILADIYNYLENIVLGKKIKNNALMAAPSGCGKTETYRAIRDYFKVHIPDLPIAQVDVSVITEEGIVGGGTELVTSSLMDSELGGYGIIFMDEFDKKLIPAFAEGANMNAAVQNQLLTIIEGREVEELYEGQPTGYTVDTSRTMFIGLGSFNESRETKKQKNKSGLGFNSTNENHDYFEEITREDMIKMGASYEMIGRFPFIVNYHKLDYKAVDKIINKTIKEISESLGVTVKISKAMREQLHKDSNGVYGCRLIDSNIRSIAMKKYVQILLNNYNKEQVVIFVDSNTKAEIKEI